MAKQSPDIKELHKVLLELTLEFDRVCRKNNIPYALTYGSALGIMNYQGFIPWDDDVDIAVNYTDLPCLIEALNRDLNHDKYYFQCYETDKKYNVLIPTMKVRKKGTYIREANYLHLPNKCRSGDGIFIDVVALMGVPSDHKKHYHIIQKSKLLMPFYVLIDAYLHLNPYGIKRYLKKLEAKVAEEYQDSSYISQTVIIPFQNWGDNKALSFRKETIYPFKEYEFEGHQLYSFQDVKTFCLENYGPHCLKEKGSDLDPYPLKKRVTKHINKIRY